MRYAAIAAHVEFFTVAVHVPGAWGRAIGLLRVAGAFSVEARDPRRRSHDACSCRLQGQQVSVRQPAYSRRAEGRRAPRCPQACGQADAPGWAPCSSPKALHEHDVFEAQARHRTQRRCAKVRGVGPNQVWVSDLTYLRTQTGFVYMAVVLDLYARRIVGWSVSRSLDVGVAVEALSRALTLRPAPAGMVHHSDRGVHYACTEYRALLASNGITPSMSRKGNCWDNAVAESFFSSFAFELEEDAEWHDVHDVERDAAAYIDGFYNPQRRHSHNRYLSPVDFERRFVQQGSAT